MLEIGDRDAAARTATLTQGERTLRTPALFWLADRTPPGDPAWTPTLGRPGDAAADAVVTTRFTEPEPAGGAGQIVLARRLGPTATVIEPEVRLDHVAQEVTSWGDAATLLRDPKRFAPALARARDEAGYARLLYAPGVGEPHHLALLAYAGIDLFDAVPLHYAAAQRIYLTESGRFPADGLTAGECACPTCQLEAPATLTRDEIAHHNQWAARAELGRVRNAIRHARLRELVEARARAHPESVALLRRLDAEHGHFEERAPVQRSEPVWATSKESLQRADCRRFRDRVNTRYRPPQAPPVLLLLPCSARKPYSKSKTHRAFADAIWAAGAAGLVHDVIVTSPLGLVPRELELTYPAAHYDVPVTGEWDEEEATMIRGMLTTHLAKRRYARVVSHLPRHTYGLVRDLLPGDTLVTCEGDRVRAPEALQRLELTLRTLASEHQRADLRRAHHERLRSLADYQFGPDVADALFRDTHSAGKWPTGKVFDADGNQLAMLPTDRGLLSLTPAGARRLLAAGAHTVEIEDFQVKGSIFAVGVRDADTRIRVGDEVVVHHAGEFRAAGVAKMNGPEMVQLRRGEAVGVRHHA